MCAKWALFHQPGHFPYPSSVTRAVMEQQEEPHLGRCWSCPSRITWTVTGLRKVSSRLCPIFSGGLSFTHCAEVRNRASFSEICFKMSCVYFSFLVRESISQIWEGITTSSLNHSYLSVKKRIILCNRNNSSSPPPCEAPPMHQSWLKFYAAAAADSFPGLHVGIPNPSALALKIPCHYPQMERQKTTDWLVPHTSSEPGQECRRILSNGKSSVETFWTVKF